MADIALAPPKEIRVGPFRFTLVFERKAVHAIDSDCNGVTSKEHCQFTVDPDRAPDAVAVTLLHEVLHAIFYANGNRQEKMTEHALIYLLSPLLLDTMRRNPDLVAYLMAEG